MRDPSNATPPVAPSTNADGAPPVAFAVHRRKKRSGVPGQWHFRIASCPFCGKSHSASATGWRWSQCIAGARLYLVVIDDPDRAVPGIEVKE
jgi:hypothetical protein